MAASQPTLNLSSWHLLLAEDESSRLRTLLGTNESRQFACSANWTPSSRQAVCTLSGIMHMAERHCTPRSCNGQRRLLLLRLYQSLAMTKRQRHGRTEACMLGRRGCREVRHPKRHTDCVLRCSVVAFLPPLCNEICLRPVLEDFILSSHTLLASTATTYLRRKDGIEAQRILSHAC